MKILTFDTSLNKTYITYGENENILFSKSVNSSSEKYHSAFLIPELLNLFKNKNISFQNIDAIGINSGPGSFTGIRICAVIARTAAQQTGCKVVCVPSLEILSKINSETKNTLVISDARKHKAYTAIYDICGNTLKYPFLTDIDDLFDIINSGDFAIVTDNTMCNFLSEKQIKSINCEAEDFELGKYLYQIVFKKLVNEQDDFHWAKAKPLYIQPPSITLSKNAGV